MTRIKTDQASSGKPLLLHIPSTVNGGYVGTNWQTLVEAPDFSIPSSGDDTAIPDPDDPNRELRPGEVFFESPLSVVNGSAGRVWVELRMVLDTLQEIPVVPPVGVPAGETVYLPIQGLRLLKENTSAVNGGRLQIRAEVGGVLTVIGSAVELEAAQHDPDSESV